MSLWRTPRAMKAFKTTPEFAALSVSLAASQGSYNALLTAGLLWSLVKGNLEFKVFLLCVLIAGVCGGLTAVGRILFIQALPALVTPCCCYRSNSNLETIET